MDREFILNEIKRLAKDEGGKAPGREAFRQATGIKPHQWLGVYWTTWSAAVAEAGLTPNMLNTAFDKTFLLENLASAVCELQKFPTSAELALYARGRNSFPPAKAFQRHFKQKPQMVRALYDFCESRDDLSDVRAICHPLLSSQGAQTAPTEPVGRPIIKGFVYLIRSGRYYKIGKSNHVGRREYEIALQVPEPVNTIHSIATDDPDGIEAYWHNRFRNKRAEGEWFSLTQDDIKAFKIRKFQ